MGASCGPSKFATIIKNTDLPAVYSNISFCTLSELRTSLSLTHLSQKSSGYLLRPGNSSERRPRPQRSRSRRWSLTRETHSKKVRLKLRPTFEAAVLHLVGPGVAAPHRMQGTGMGLHVSKRYPRRRPRLAMNERAMSVLNADARSKYGQRGILWYSQAVWDRGNCHRPRP